MRGLCTLFLILLFCQFPVFVEQYKMHLEGHKNEAEKVYVLLTQAAAASGKSLDKYIEKFTTHADPDIMNQGNLMKNMSARYLFLCLASDRLEHANPLLRPLVFLRSMDREIMFETARSFSPGLLLTKEMLLWAAFGWLLGFFVFSRKRLIA